MIELDSYMPSLEDFGRWLFLEGGYEYTMFPFVDLGDDINWVMDDLAGRSTFPDIATMQVGRR